MPCTLTSSKWGGQEVTVHVNYLSLSNWALQRFSNVLSLQETEARKIRSLKVLQKDCGDLSFSSQVFLWCQLLPVGSYLPCQASSHPSQLAAHQRLEWLL